MQAMVTFNLPMHAMGEDWRVRRQATGVEEQKTEYAIVIDQFVTSEDKDRERIKSVYINVSLESYMYVYDP